MYMEDRSRFAEMVRDIDKILESQVADTKTLTLIKQRGFLTGWLARLATQDYIIHDEIKARLRQLEDK